MRVILTGGSGTDFVAEMAFNRALKSSLGREAKGEHYKCCEQLK